MSSFHREGAAIECGWGEGGTRGGMDRRGQLAVAGARMLMPSFDPGGCPQCWGWREDNRSGVLHVGRSELSVVP
jgi:hypothetical protein